jgi:hypothetical protein
MTALRLFLVYAILTGFGFFLHGCDESDGKPGADPQPAETQDRIDRLLSLPYVSGTKAPKDSPSGVIKYDKAKTCPGYRLYAIPIKSEARLIDEQGDIVHSWTGNKKHFWARVELFPSGELLVVGRDSREGNDNEEGQKRAIADSSRFVMKLDWAGEVVWKRKMLAHHDVKPAPDGNILLLTYQRVPVPEIHPEVDTRDDHVTMLDQNGNVLESISMLDVFRDKPEIFPFYEMKPSKRGGKPWIDLFHSNSIEWIKHENLFGKHEIYNPDNVLVCIRNQNRIAFINWPERKPVLAWGLNHISGPHDAHLLKNGNVLLFDNGLATSTSRAVEVNPLTGKVAWEYRGNPPESFFTPSRGSVQRLPGGNTLIAESDKGHAIEVTSGGEIVWEFNCRVFIENDKRAAINRMICHPRAFIEKLLARDK